MASDRKIEDREVRGAKDGRTVRRPSFQLRLNSRGDESDTATWSRHRDTPPATRCESRRAGELPCAPTSARAERGQSLDPLKGRKRAALDMTKEPLRT